MAKESILMSSRFEESAGTKSAKPARFKRPHEIESIKNHIEVLEMKLRKLEARTAALEKADMRFAKREARKGRPTDDVDEDDDVEDED